MSRAVKLVTERIRERTPRRATPEALLGVVVDVVRRLEATGVLTPDGDGVAPATSGVAHSPQNFASALLAAPQDGQTSASRAAHSLQNLRPASFSVPQFEQTTRRSEVT